jgi:hypothetical protein
LHLLRRGLLLLAVVTVAIVAVLVNWRPPGDQQELETWQQ